MEKTENLLNFQKINTEDVLKSQKGSAFTTYDIEEDSILNKNENEQSYCSYGNKGTWWKVKRKENCDNLTNLNSFNFDEMMFFRKKNDISRITISNINANYYSLRKCHRHPVHN